MAGLNIEAPEFHPRNQLYKLQSTNFPTPFQPHHYHLTLYSFRPEGPFYYYPTLSTTLPSSQAQGKPPYHVETQEQQQQEKKKVIKSEKTNSSKGFVKKEVFETVNRGPRFFSNGGLRFQAFEWRKKEPKQVVRERRYCVGPSIENREKVVGEQKNFRASSSFFQKRAFPVVPAVRENGEETTVMIKNIPSKYTRDMLVEFLENHCMIVNEESGEENSLLAFDFVYLPIDFQTGMNKGYAFVNFTKPTATWKFVMSSSGRKWELFHSDKIRQVVLARIQGKKNLESHFKTMNFPYEFEDVLPLSFDPPRDGVIKGNQKTLGRLLKGTNQL